MKKLFSLLVLTSILLMLCGCGSETEERAEFAFPMPKGYSLTGSSEYSRDILREADGQTVGGIRLTELSARDLRKGLYGRYLDEVSGSPLGSEYFSWEGGSRRHPVCYIDQFVSHPGVEEKAEFKRVLFERNKQIYDLWFDLKCIDSLTVGDLFYPIAEPQG